MPVTAKLSRRFYEQFGDELTNELVEWFNSVDATYQSDLRELNENNFARFDAKLEQRIAGVEAKIEGLEARLDARIAGLDGKIVGVEGKIVDLEGRIDTKMDQRFAEQRERFAVFESRMTRWMFTLWTGTMLAFAGLAVAVLRSK
jgi:hypothetical protein